MFTECIQRFSFKFPSLNELRSIISMFEVVRVDSLRNKIQMLKITVCILKFRIWTGESTLKAIQTVDLFNKREKILTEPILQTENTSTFLNFQSSGFALIQRSCLADLTSFRKPSLVRGSTEEFSGPKEKRDT